MGYWGKKTSCRSYNLILELVGAHLVGSMVYLVYISLLECLILDDSTARKQKTSHMDPMAYGYRKWYNPPFFLGDYFISH